MRLLQSLFFVLFSVSLFAQSSAIGTWKAIDDKDGEPTSHVKIYDQDGKIFGKIVKLFDQPDDVLCEECEGDQYNQPILGMVIITNLKKDGNEWSGGKILDPEDGNTYKCKITLPDANTLNLRGYIGIPALGRTQTWYRVD